MDQLKIAFIEDDTADGGLGMVFRSLASYFSQFAKVYYFSTRINNGRIPFNITYVPFERKRQFKENTNGLSQSLSGCAPLHSLLKEYKPDIAISFGFYSNIRLCLSAWGTPTKVLVSERGNATRFHGVYRLALTFLMARANKIVFQSKAAQNAYPAILGKKGVVINNAIFKENLPDSSEAVWDNRVVSVGRIHPDKNFPLLLQAFQKIAQEFPDIRLEIFGEEEPGSPEPYLMKLQQLATDIGIQERVCFMGQSDDIGRDLFGARLFVLSSILEGMPNALIEAMACGIPCITTNFLPGCAGEIVTDGIDGAIVKNNDVEHLAQKMRSLLADDVQSREIARQAIKIRQRLSRPNIFEKWNQEILKCVNPHEDRK